MFRRLLDNLLFLLWSALTTYQVDAFRNSISMSFFEVVIDLVVDYQAAVTDEERLRYLRAVRVSLSDISERDIPDAVIEKRMVDLQSVI